MFSNFIRSLSFVVLSFSLYSTSSFAKSGEKSKPSYSKNCNLLYELKLGQSKPKFYVEYCGIAKKVILLNAANESGYKQSTTLSQSNYNKLYNEFSKIYLMAGKERSKCRHTHSLYSPVNAKKPIHYCPNSKILSQYKKIEKLLKH